MRVCSVITSFTSGGAEMLVCNLAEGFAAGGHQASVVALSDAAQVGNPVEIERAIMDRVVDAGGRTASLALRNRNAWITGAARMRRVMRQLQPDIIHAHTARALPLLALARPGVPIVLTHHNSRWSFPPRALALFDRIVYAYVAISDACALQIAQHARRPIRKILNAASDRFQASERTATARDPVILTVGTVSEQKDYPTLIRAARPLAERLARDGRCPHIRITGGGPMLGALREFVEREGAGEYVELLGARSDVDALMRDADLYANTSLWEGFSIALIEASMSALPIVATDVAGNRELIEDGVNGRLVPTADPVATAEAIAAVLTSGGTYAAMSRASLGASRRFSIDHCAAAHLALYRDALASGPRFAPAAARAWAE